MTSRLTIHDHSRDSVGMTYVYPVISRRARGVSVGVNLNINSACNWACVYCQVPNLTRGGPPPLDIVLLESELRQFFDAALHSDFLLRNAPPESRQLVDIAFSGNGEPTSASEFADAVMIANRILADFSLAETVTIRLITNGSLLHRPSVQQGIALIGQSKGEVWFKLDRATTDGMQHINGVNLSPETVRANLGRCTELAPTWLQTCFFAMDGALPDSVEQQAYVDLVRDFRERIRGVHLYGLARPSMQPEAARLGAAKMEELEQFAALIAALGVEVRIAP